MPSGSRGPSLTITLRSEPSGFADNTWPLLALRKNNRAAVVFGAVFLIFDLEDLSAMSFLRSFITSSFWQTGWIRNREFAFIPLHEGADPGYGFTENQVLHLEGAFVGIKRFRIHKEAPNVVVRGDTITAQEFPRPCDRLAALGRSERFGKRGMRI